MKSVFVSYSHHDVEIVEWIDKHLAPLRRTCNIQYWSDQHIQAGSNWKQEIDIAIANADLAILAVTPHFVSSQFIIESELPALAARGIRMLPIAINYSSYDLIPDLKALQFVNDVSKPYAKLRSHERALLGVELAKTVAAHFEQLGKDQPLRPPEGLGFFLATGGSLTVNTEDLAAIGAPEEMIEKLRSSGVNKVFVQKGDERIFHFSFLVHDQPAHSILNQRFRLTSFTSNSTIFKSVITKPYALEIELSNTSLDATTRLHLDSEGATVLDVLPIYRFIDASYDSEFEIFVEDIGSSLTKGPPRTLGQKMTEMTEILEKLCELQKILKRVFVLPGKDQIEPEADLIDEIFEVVTTGERRPPGVNVTLKPSRSLVEKILERMGAGIEGELSFSSESAYLLLGQEISLGPQILTIEGFVLPDKDRMRLTEQIKDASKDTFELDIQSNGKPVILTYPNWRKAVKS